MILTEFPDILTIVIRQLEVRMCWNHGYKKPLVHYDASVDQDCSIVAMNETGKIMFAWPGKTFRVFSIFVCARSKHALPPNRFFVTRLNWF